MEAEEALAEALDLCQEQELELASLRAAPSPHNRQSDDMRDSDREEAMEYLTRMGKRMTALEASLLDLDVTLSAARLEATPGGAGFTANAALLEEKRRTRKLEEQLEAALCESAARGARFAAAMAEARTLAAELENVKTERRREHVSAAARIQMLECKLEVSQERAEALSDELRLTCAGSSAHPPPPPGLPDGSRSRARAMTPPPLSWRHDIKFASDSHTKAPGVGGGGSGMSGRKEGNQDNGANESWRGGSLANMWGDENAETATGVDAGCQEQLGSRQTREGEADDDVTEAAARGVPGRWSKAFDPQSGPLRALQNS